MADNQVPWQGLVIPYDEQQPIGDQRTVAESQMHPPHRMLPLPLKWQETSAPGHSNAKQGLANITRVWSEPDGLYASGYIDGSDAEGARLAEKIKNGFAGWISGDLATDGGQATRSGTRYRNWQLTGATLVGDPAFEAARITIGAPSNDAAPDRELSGVAAMSLDHTITFAHGTRLDTFAVTGDVDLPWAPRDREWDGDAASRRVQDWADGDADRMGRAFLWRDPDADPTTQAAYSLGFADVIDGELHAIYAGLSAAAGRLNQTGISPADRERVDSRINTLYERAANAFDDPTIGQDRQEMAMAEIITEVPADEADTTTEVTISDADIARIADAVVARLNDRDETAQAEFTANAAKEQRVNKVLSILGVR